MMKKESVEIKELYKNIIASNKLTKEVLIDSENAETCHVCGYEFYDKDKFRDHDHLTGKCRRGAVHNDCNLNYKNLSYLPVYINNLSNYDVHLFIEYRK